MPIVESAQDNVNPERRRYPRVKAKVQVELLIGDSTAPMRTSTDEISLCGCYVESMMTFEIGTKVALNLWVNGELIKATAVVATRYPQVGNGFDFVEMKPEDRLKLNEYIVAAENQNT